jgi:hypothetical protein
MCEPMTLPRLACAVLCLVVACSDDDETRPRYTSGVVDNSVTTGGGVGRLGDPDLERICRSLDAYVETHISFDAIAYIACLPAAIVFGGDRAGCERQLDECMALFPEPITVRARLDNTQVCYESLRRCDASVSALEGCINVNLDLAFQIIDNWSCSGVGDRDLRAEAARAMDTASVCADLSAACNDFATLAGPD